MFNLLTDSKRDSDSFISWVASASMSGMGADIPNYESVIARQISSHPEMLNGIKEAMVQEADRSLELMLNHYDRPSIDELYYRFTMVNGKLIHVEVDVELCYRLGFTSYQFLGQTLSLDVIPAEHLEHKQHMYQRAWNGEIVDYIGASLNGTGYTARLTPTYDESKRVIFVEVVCRLLASLHIDADVMKEVGEFQPRMYAISKGSGEVCPQ